MIILDSKGKEEFMLLCDNAFKKLVNKANDKDHTVLRVTPSDFGISENTKEGMSMFYHVLDWLNENNFIEDYVKIENVRYVDNIKLDTAYYEVYKKENEQTNQQ